MTYRKNLVLHIPYPRLAKHALCKPFVDLLNEKFDVTILATFKISEADLVYLGLKKEQFVYYQIDDNLIHRNIYRLVDYFRRYSFFFRNSNKLKLGNLEELSRPPYPKILRWIGNLLSLCKLDYIFWRGLDTFLWRFYTPQNIRNLNLNCDIFIQFSNWGFNDFTIKNAKFLKNAKKFFFPYSLDQLNSTGYLLFEFEKIYCQSAKEQYLLMLCHNYKKKSGLAGSLWFRHIDFLLNRKEIAIQRKPNSIVYAGSSSLFFPKYCEVQFVNSLQKYYPNYEIVYLPLYLDFDKNKDELVNIHKSIKVKFHKISLTSVSSNTVLNLKSDIVSYIENLIGTKFFVMAFITSMGIDFSYLNKKKIFSHFKDSQGKVAASPHVNMDRIMFYGPHYQEIEDSYRFTSLDEEIVEPPSSNNWDAEIELSTIVQELYEYSQK